MVQDAQKGSLPVQHSDVTQVTETRTLQGAREGVKANGAASRKQYNLLDLKRGTVRFIILLGEAIGGQGSNGTCTAGSDW